MKKILMLGTGGTITSRQMENGLINDMQMQEKFYAQINYDILFIKRK